MPIHDLSGAVRARTTVYPGDPPVAIDTPVALANGDAANVSRLRLGAHTGTHVDAPAHFLAEGRRVNDLPLDALIGEARVIEIPESVRAIGPEHVTDAIVAGAERVLFKTRNSSFWAEERFREDFTSRRKRRARSSRHGSDSSGSTTFRSKRSGRRTTTPTKCCWPTTSSSSREST